MWRPGPMYRGVYRTERDAPINEADGRAALRSEPACAVASARTWGRPPEIHHHRHAIPQWQSGHPGATRFRDREPGHLRRVHAAASHRR
ncbi:MAG: hypothetical protein H6Q90_1092, partial [Deltaproteobacteria bacterium]|nr:hypothetical protein [Deltaproteobacteria bacterium]